MAELPTLSCIIYDLDGTLIDSVPDIAAAVNRVRESFALPPVPEFIVRAHVGDGAMKLLERTVYGLVKDPVVRPENFLPKSGIPAEQLLRQFLNVYGEDPIGTTKLYEGVDPALRYWNKLGVAQVLLTNKPQSITETILDQLEIADLFDVVIGDGSCDDDGNALPSKPDPAIIDHILEETGAPKEETWMVGDGVPDVAVAKAAGISVVAILGGYTEPEILAAECPDLDFAVPSFLEGYKLLRERTRPYGQ